MMHTSTPGAIPRRAVSSRAGILSFGVRQNARTHTFI